MKKRAANRLLSWLMSAVMVVGEFGGMPLAVNANEDVPIEATEEEIPEEEAVIEEDDAAFCVSEEETVPSDSEEIVVEEAQNDPGDPVQIDVIPKKGDGVYTWEELERLDDYTDGWQGRDGRFYLANNGYGIGVSTSNDADPNDIKWIDGAVLYRVGTAGNYSGEGCVEINELITNMVLNKQTGDIDFANGEYYVYVGCGLPYSKASDQTFTFTYETGAAAAVAGYHEYRENYVRYDDEDDRWIWWEDDNKDQPRPQTCPDGYLNKNNYQIVMKDAENEGVIGYIVRAKGSSKIIDRGFGEGDPQMFIVCKGDSDIPGTSSAWSLIDDYEGIEVAAIRNNGQISEYVQVPPMAPWDSDDRYVSWDSPVNFANGKALFEAPEYSHGFDTWTEYRDEEDDVLHVNNCWYRVFVNKPDAAANDSKWVEINPEHDTVRTGTGDNITDISTIYENDILIEMNRKYLEDKANGDATLEQGTYDVWILTGKDGIEYYNVNSFEIEFAYPTGNADVKDIGYGWHTVFVKNTDDGIKEYERAYLGKNEEGEDIYEDDDAIRAKMETEEYKDYYEMKMVDLAVLNDPDAIGYIIKLKAGKEILNWDGNTTNMYVSPVHDGYKYFNFIVPADFKINKDATITRITAGAKSVVGAKARPWYDEEDLEENIVIDNKSDDEFWWTPSDGMVRQAGPNYFEFAEKCGYDMQISYLDDPDGIQDCTWYNWVVRPESMNRVSVDKYELLYNLVRDKVEAELTAGKRGNADFNAGRYGIVIIACNENGPFARSKEIIVDFSKLAKVSDSIDLPKVLYHTGTDWFRLMQNERGDWSWQSINDFYYTEEAKKYLIKEDENHILEWWHLSDEQRAAYIATVNADLSADKQFKELNTLDCSLSSTGADVIGYLVRLIDNSFTYNEDDSSVMESRMKGEGADPDRNMETHMSGVLEKPVEEGKLMVAAVYRDGTISDWCYGRERQEWDEWPRIDTGLDIDDGIVSWTQEYLRNDDGEVIYRNGDPNCPELENGVDVYVAGPDDIWYRVDAYYTWDTEHNMASVELADILTYMAFNKFQNNPDMVSGEYKLYVMKYTESGRKVSKSDVVFNFKPVAEEDARFTAVYKEHDKWVKKVADDPDNEDTNYHFEDRDQASDGYNKTLQYEVLIKSNAANVAGYLINVDKGIMDANRDNLKYSWFHNGFEGNEPYAAQTWEYVKASDEIKIAAVYTDGTMSEWVTAVNWSRADDCASADMGIAYNTLTGEFSVSREKLNALDARLKDFTGDGNAEFDGYKTITNANIVLRGVDDYDFGNRVLKKTEGGNTVYRADSSFLPVRAAVDELMNKAGQKNTWDDDNGHHEQPWAYLSAGTYRATFLIPDQRNGNTLVAAGLASDQEITFTYKNGDKVSAPAGVTYSYETDENGRHYTVHISETVDEAIAYIIRYRDGEGKYTYKDRFLDEDGFFYGDFGDEMAVCAVDMYGNISTFAEAEPEVSGIVAENNQIEVENCRTVYPRGYSGDITLDGATLMVTKYDTIAPVEMEIYELARQTGGTIRLDHADDIFTEENDYDVEVRLYGGRLKPSDSDYRVLGSVSIMAKDMSVDTVTSTLELDRTDYFIGQVPGIKDGGTVTIKYNDADETTISVTAPAEALVLSEVNAGDLDGSGAFAKAGKIEFNVKLDGEELYLYSHGAKGDKVVLSANVIQRAVVSVAVTPPEKTNYFVGEPAMDLTGGVLVATWNDGRKETMTLDAAGVSVSGFDSANAADDQVITVTYGGKSDNFSVVIAEPAVTRIKVKTDPAKMTYLEGESFDAEGGKLTVYKEYGEPADIDMENGMGPDITGLTAGTHEIAISYGGKSVTLTIVINPVITAIELASTPDKLVYFKGEALNVTGGVLKLIYSDNHIEKINLTLLPAENISGYNKDQLGNQVIRVTYEGREVTFNVTVKQFDHIAIADRPLKTEYVVGQAFDPTGGTIAVVFTDGVNTETEYADITAAMVSGYDPAVAGEQVITVTYNGKTATFKVTVVAKAVESISVKTQPAKLDYHLDDDLSVTGGELTVKYNDGELQTIAMTAEGVTVSGYDKTKAGEQTVTLTYENKTARIKVNVIAKEITKIEIASQPAKVVYDVNTDLDVTGGKIKITYNYGDPETIDMTAAMISGYDKTRAGEQTLTVTYSGKTASFKVTVKAENDEREVTKIEIATLPEKLVYELNEDLDLTGGTIRVTYTTGDPETIAISENMISGYNRTKAGKQTVTVTYGSKTATFEVTVKAEDDYEFDPTVQEEPVVGEGMKVFFDDASLTQDDEGIYHITYTGKAIKPLVRVTDNRVILTEGVDYTVKYKDNKDVGTAIVTVTGKGTYSSYTELKFMIDRRSIAEAEIGGLVTTDINKVRPVVVYGGKVLKNNKDYTFRITEGSVEFEGIGNFIETTTEVVEVLTSKEIKKLGIKVKYSDDMPKSFIYDGTAQTVDEYLIVTDGSGEETDEYAVSYSDNVNAGRVTVMIVGTGSHKGKVKKTFKIKPNTTTEFEVTVTQKEVEFNKNGAKPFIVVSANETYELLTQGVDYTVKYSNNKKGGATATAKLQFKGNYKGASYKEKIEFSVKKPSLEKANTNVSDNYIIAGDMVYGKKAKYQPKAYVVVDGTLLPVKKEYTLEYSEKDKLTGPKDNLLVTANTKGKNYDGSATVSYNVVDGTGKTDVNKAKVVLTESGKNKVYGGAGEEIRLTPGTDFTVKIGKTEITNGAAIEDNFDIFYADNTGVGKATIILKGKGNYVGVFAGNFTIKKAIIKKN